MSGTRLYIIIIYSIQIIFLFALAFYLSIQNSYSKTQNKWSRIHLPFVTDRRGLSSLKSSRGADDDGNNNGDLFSLLYEIKKDYYDINQVQLYVTHHGIESDENILVEDDRHNNVLQDSLQRGIDYHMIDHDGTTTSTTPIVTVKSSINNDLEYDCNEVDLLKIPTLDNYIVQENKELSDLSSLTFMYPIHIIHNCHDGDKVKIDINDFGAIVIRFARNATWEAKKFALEHSISDFLSSWLISSSSSSSSFGSSSSTTTSSSSTTTSSTKVSQKRNILSYSSIKVVSTLIDSDPMSHVSPTTNTSIVTPFDHYQLLLGVFQEQMNQSISSMINQLSEETTTTSPKAGLYQSTNLLFHGVTYIGQDFVTKAIHTEYQNDVPNDYIISLNTATDMIHNGEIGNSIGLFDGSSSSADEGNVNELVLNLVFFLPPSTSMPLFIQNDDHDGSSSWSPALTTSRKNTLFSIVNIDTNLKGHELVYQNAVRQSISYVGSQIRKQFGLTPIPLDALGKHSYSSDEDEILVEYHYTSPTSLGIAPWEVDKLTRYSWSVKVDKAVQLIERIEKLVHSRNMIAISLEVRDFLLFSNVLLFLQDYAQFP